jgi:hypothetical protein
MRVRNSPQDAEFVQWISQLPYNPALNGPISLPSFVAQPQSIEELLNKVYPIPLLAQAVTDYTIFRGRAILSTKNAIVTELNEAVSQAFPGRSRTYLAVNSADVNDSDLDIDEVPAEFLQSINIPSLPPSRLDLKKGSPIILLRNLCPKEGLCNGTRMVVTELHRYCIQARILGGDFDGQLRTIPRIKLTSSDEDDLPFMLSRKQFPVRLCFAMTINKSQGQSFETIGLDLRSPVFSHGQFYVAVSRVTSASGLSVLLPQDSTATSNIVYPEVLQDIN